MRPTKDQWFLSMAQVIATRTTCKRAGVGCVLVDGSGIILSTGYNGPPRGLPHCTDRPCAGADAFARPDSCEAVHAEINALVQFTNIRPIHTCYVTTEPCFRCTKALLNTDCSRVLFLRENGDGGLARELWFKAMSHRAGPVDGSLRTDMRLGWELARKRAESC